LNPMDYHIWGIVRGLSPAEFKTELITEPKEMLQVTAQLGD